MIINFKNQEIEITNVYGKYDDDIQFDARYVESDTEIDDIDLLDEIMQENFDSIYELWYQQKVGESDYFYERD